MTIRSLMVAVSAFFLAASRSGLAEVVRMEIGQRQVPKIFLTQIR